MDVIVEGGTWRRPGPSLSGTLGLEGMGKRSGEIVSPGSMVVAVALACLSDDDSTAHVNNIAEAVVSTF